jgi:hypothetical protein
LLESYHVTEQQREGHRLTVFQNMTLKGMFGLQREEVTGGWRQLHNERFRNLQFSPNISLLVRVPKGGGGAKDLPLPLNFGKQ